MPRAETERSRLQVLGLLSRLDGEIQEPVAHGADWRFALRGALLPDGRAISVPRSRELQWEWDLAKERDRLRRCSTAYTLLYTPDAADRYMAAPVTCGSRLCPHCFRFRAGKGVGRWAPLLAEALATRGSSLWHVCLTQPTRPGRGSCVLAHESDRWIGRAPGGGQNVAVAGETASESFERWLGTFKQARRGRDGRRRWGGLGVLRGIEWTLRRGGRRSPPRQRPRWHCHGHLIVIAPPPWGDAWTPAELMTDWYWRNTGQRRKPRLQQQNSEGNRNGLPPRPGPFLTLPGQWAERIHSPDAIREVIKYPFKGSDMTVAGMLDAWAALRGCKTHQAVGALHASSTAYKGSPWREWREGACEPPFFGAVQWREAGTGYDDDTGWARFAMTPEVAAQRGRVGGLTHDVRIRTPEGWRVQRGYSSDALAGLLSSLLSSEATVASSDAAAAAAAIA